MIPSFLLPFSFVVTWFIYRNEVTTPKKETSDTKIFFPPPPVPASIPFSPFLLPFFPLDTRSLIPPSSTISNGYVNRKKMK